MFSTQIASLVVTEWLCNLHLFEISGGKNVSTQPVSPFFSTQCKHSQIHILHLFGPLKAAFLYPLPPPHQVPSSRCAPSGSFPRTPPPADDTLGFPGVPASFIHSCGPSCQATGLQSRLLLILDCQNLNFHLRSPGQTLLCSHPTG